MVLVGNMKLEKILLALFGGIGFVSKLELANAEPQHQSITRNREQRILSLNDFDSTSTLPRALGLSAIENGPKKAKSKGSSKGSNKTGKSKGSNKDGDDDDSHTGKGEASPTYSPTWENMPSDMSIEHTEPKEPKKSKKPKHESMKDKGAKIEKSTKGYPTYKPIPSPSAESKYWGERLPYCCDDSRYLKNNFSIICRVLQ
jgi:hypothetical protein